MMKLFATVKRESESESESGEELRPSTVAALEKIISIKQPSNSSRLHNKPQEMTGLEPSISSM